MLSQCEIKNMSKFNDFCDMESRSPLEMATAEVFRAKAPQKRHT